MCLLYGLTAAIPAFCEGRESNAVALIRAGDDATHCCTTLLLHVIGNPTGLTKIVRRVHQNGCQILAYRQVFKLSLHAGVICVGLGAKSRQTVYASFQICIAIVGCNNQ